MRRWFPLLAMAMLGVPASPARAQPAPTPPKSVALPDIPTALSNIAATYRAPEHEMWFTQTYLAKAYNATSTSQGTLTFAKPDKLSFRYTNGYDLVVNGPTTGAYDPTQKAFYFQASTASPHAAVGLAFVPGALASQCNLTIYPGSQLQYPNGYVLLCDPKVPSSAFTKLLLYVDAVSSEVRRVLLLDAQGNRDRFDFDQLQPHPAVSWQLFSLTPPPGAVVFGKPTGTGPTAPAPTSSSASPLTPRPPRP